MNSEHSHLAILVAIRLFKFIDQVPLISVHIKWSTKPHVPESFLVGLAVKTLSYGYCVAYLCVQAKAPLWAWSMSFPLFTLDANAL